MIPPPVSAITEKLAECIAELYSVLTSPTHRRFDSGWDGVANIHAKLLTLESGVAADARDARRWRWAREILAGDNEKAANIKALKLGAGLIAGKTVEETIDAALSLSGDEGGERE